MKIYAVRKGRKTGLFEDWATCKAQVDKFQGAEFKSFGSIEEAKEYLNSASNLQDEDDDTNSKHTITFKDDEEDDNLSFNQDKELSEFTESPPRIEIQQETVLLQGILNGLSDDINEGIAYVDGSFTSIGIVGAGYTLVSKLGLREGMASQDDDTSIAYRNVAGELLATIKVIEAAISDNLQKITIYHDYQGIQAWADGDWKTNKVITKVYKEMIKLAREKIQIKFKKVKAHSGNLLNNRVDRLAKQAITSSRAVRCEPLSDYFEEFKDKLNL